MGILACARRRCGPKCSACEGGKLDLDSNAACITPLDGINNEQIVWTAGKAPHGTYIVRVDNFENCSGAATNFVVTVQTSGHAAQTFSGDFAAADAGDFGLPATGPAIGTEITRFTW